MRSRLSACRVRSPRSLAYAALVAAGYAAVACGRRAAPFVGRGARARPGRVAADAGGRRLAALAAVVLAAGPVVSPAAPDRLTVSFLDVGQGDATLVQHPDGSAVLFDGGRAGRPRGAAAPAGGRRPAERGRRDARVRRPPRRPGRGAARAFRSTCSSTGATAPPIRTSGRCWPTARARGVPIAAGARRPAAAGGRPLDRRPVAGAPAARARSGGPEPARGRRDREQRGVRAHAVRRRREPDARRRSTCRTWTRSRSRTTAAPTPASPTSCAALRPEVAVIEVGENSYGHPHPGHAAHARATGPVRPAHRPRRHRPAHGRRTAGWCSSRRRARDVHSRRGRAEARLPDLRRRRREDRRLARPRPRPRRARARPRRARAVRRQGGRAPPPSPLRSRR